MQISISVSYYYYTSTIYLVLFNFGDELSTTTTALEARKRLMAIRKAIPSVTIALTRLNKNPENTILSKSMCMKLHQHSIL